MAAVDRQTPQQAGVIEGLRNAMIDLFGAERRLRAREQQRPGSLTNSQLRALSALALVDEVPAGELAKAADLQPASVTAMLDQLEANGIIERRRRESDRRVSMVSLTAQGRELLAERRERWQDAWEAQFAAMPEDDLLVALAVLRQMIEMLERL